MEDIATLGLLGILLSLVGVYWWRPRDYPVDLELSSAEWPVRVSEPPALTTEQEEMLAPIVQILATDDARHIVQAFELLDALNDPALNLALAWGISVGEDHRLAVSSDARLAKIEGMGTYDLGTRSDLCQLTALCAGVRSELFETETTLELALPTTEGMAALLAEAVSTADGLEELRIGGFYELDDLSFLKGLRRLKRLDLSLGGHLKSLEGLGELPALEELKLGAQQALEDLSGLAGLSRLRIVDVRDCESIADVSVLGSLSELEEVVMLRCVGITDVSSLASLTKVTMWDLRGCAGLPEGIRLRHSAIGMPLNLKQLLEETGPDRVQSNPVSGNMGA
ncbi:MAG: hypothetical protein VX938_10935, partial [Myxococcota bacterium]|nr:hypothetical protein [Myxococcota bacterium]